MSSTATRPVAKSGTIGNDGVGGDSDGGGGYTSTRHGGVGVPGSVCIGSSCAGGEGAAVLSSGAHHCLAGAVGGSLECLGGFPMDTVKVRPRPAYRMCIGAHVYPHSCVQPVLCPFHWNPMDARSPNTTPT